MISSVTLALFAAAAAPYLPMLKRGMHDGDG
jgi:hypothetical protein